MKVSIAKGIGILRIFLSVCCVLIRRNIVDGAVHEPNPVAGRDRHRVYKKIQHNSNDASRNRQLPPIPIQPKKIKVNTHSGDCPGIHVDG
jgi:hypothetical protein